MESLYIASQALVGKVLGFSFVVWGYHFAGKIKILLIELLKFYISG